MLGRGAMGVVYRAYDPAIGRRVAIKLIRADLLEGAERDGFVGRFSQEAQAAGRCMHPNIVMVHDFAVHDGNPFLAMEYIEGESLAAMLARAGRFMATQAAAVILQVLAALDAAHALGIVHRDVKPANILLLPDGRVKMTDFGIARIDSAAATQSGVVIGTPSYMSPEQYRGQTVDARSDLFSAGAVLFEMLSGNRPFPGRNIAEVAQSLLDPAPVDFAERLAGQPPGLIAAVHRAMAKRPEDRFASATAMAAALRALRLDQLEPAPTTATIVHVPRRTPQPEAATHDPLILATIERRLAVFVGPIAGHLVRAAARQADTLEGLCVALGDRIARPEEREAFLDQVLRGGATIPPAVGPATRQPIGAPVAMPAGGGGVPAATVERVQRDLARAVGPIARLLVRRAAPQAGSEAALRQTLAAHIEDAAERTAFLTGAAREK